MILIDFEFYHRFTVKVGPQNAKGIHLRKGVLNKPEEFTVSIHPVYKNDLDCGRFNQKIP